VKAGKVSTFRKAFVGRFLKAKRRLILGERNGVFLGVPRRVTHFKAKRNAGGRKSKKVFQQGNESTLEWRELPRGSVEVVAVVQHTGDFQETFRVLSQCGAFECE